MEQEKVSSEGEGYLLITVVKAREEQVGPYSEKQLTVIVTPRRAKMAASDGETRFYNCQSCKPQVCKPRRRKEGGGNTQDCLPCPTRRLTVNIPYVYVQLLLLPMRS